MRWGRTEIWRSCKEDVYLKSELRNAGCPLFWIYSTAQRHWGILYCGIQKCRFLYVYLKIFFKFFSCSAHRIRDGSTRWFVARQGYAEKHFYMDCELRPSERCCSSLKRWTTWGKKCRIQVTQFRGSLGKMYHSTVEATGWRALIQLPT